MNNNQRRRNYQGNYQQNQMNQQNNRGQNNNQPQNNRNGNGGIYNKMRNSRQQQLATPNYNNQNVPIEQRLRKNQPQTPQNQSNLSIEQRLQRPQQQQRQQNQTQTQVQNQPRLKTLRVANGIRKQQNQAPVQNQRRQNPANQQRQQNVQQRRQQQQKNNTQQTRVTPQNSQRAQSQQSKNTEAQVPKAPVSNLPAPIQNPCGIPFKNNKTPDEAELKGLQIRAELMKLGEPSRSYSEHLQRMVSEDVPMSFADAGRILLSQRFQQIMGAKPASSPYVARNTPTTTANRQSKLKNLRQRKQGRRAGRGTGTTPVAKTEQSQDNILKRLYAN